MIYTGIEASEHTELSFRYIIHISHNQNKNEYDRSLP